MSFNLYNLCIIYWLACTVIISILGFLTIRETNKSETAMGLVCFGKIRNDHNFKIWLRMIEMPKRFFWIFYLVATICTVFGLIDVIIDDQLRYNNSPAFMLINLLFYLTHVLRRLYECLFVSVFSDSNMNILHFLLGITFYPLCVCSQLSSFTLQINLPFSALVVFYTVLAISIFVVQLHQHHCFVLLASLRLNNGLKTKNKNIHVMPHGGFFEYCLSPHYFFEIVLYFLFAIAYRLSAAMLLCFLFVVVNQTIAALLNQSWYRRHFREYSFNRKALVPYIL